MKLFLFVISIFYLSVLELVAQTSLGWMSLPSESSVTNGPTNGMWFTAPADITIKALKVPDDSMNPFNPQSIAVLKFTGGGASTSPATNYTVLFLIQDTTAADSVPCNIPILSGDHIGIIGSRWNASSNVGQCSNASSSNYSTSINGYSTPLYKLNANSPLNNQAPSVVWMPSTSASIARVEVYYEGCQLPYPDAVTPTSLLCYGDTNGSITASITGSLGPYVMEWSNLDSNVTNISGLTAGQYTVTIEDSSGCRYDTTGSITQPDSLILAFNDQEPLCFGDANGSLSVAANGGISPYSYSWNTSSIDSIITAIQSGSYSITVTDSNGCEVLETYYLAQPELLQIGLDSVEHNTCPESQIGEIWTTIIGGVAPYSGLWDDSAGTIQTDVFNLGNGNYTYSITDLNGCAAHMTDSVMALNPTPFFTLGVNQSLPTTGTLLLNGPANMSSYQWSTGSGFHQININTPGIYWLNILDTNGCASSDTIEIYPPIPEGIALPEQSILKIYPNPSDGNLIISNGGSDQLAIDILNQLGQLLRSESLSAGITELNISDLPSGVYLLRVEEKGYIKLLRR